MSRLSLSAIAVAALLALVAAAPVNGMIGTYDKLTYLTFTGPVQVPGVTLNAGTYRFRLTNPDTSRNVLQVLSNDGAIVYAMFHTIYDSRTVLTDDSTVTFRETPVGVAPAVKSLFYGGEYRGYEFVYPKGGPNMIAEVRPQPPITYAPIPVVAPEPVPEPTAEPAVVEAVPEPAQAPAPAPAELPRTASALPWIGVGGLTSLLAGLGLILLRRHGG